MEPFDSYPNGGNQLLGLLDTSTNCRHIYGLKVQRLTKQTNCAYCGVSLVDDIYHWLLMSIDHVIPVAQAIILGIPIEYSKDIINTVLSCKGCNEIDNQYEVPMEPQLYWELDEFIALRNDVFVERRARIAERMRREKLFFEERPWQNP